MKASLSVLNCLWSLENEQSSECWGGVSADPVVSAVLNAVGKRYLVEKGESEDGNQTWEQYSDGYKVCTIRGYYSIEKHNETFPVEYASPPIVMTTFEVESVNVPPFQNWAFDITTTGFSFRGANANQSFVILGY